MKTIKIKLIILLTLICTSASAEMTYMNTPVVENTVDGIESSAISIVSDSFTTMTHYSKGNWIARVTPAYFEIGQINDSPGIEGKGLNGYSLSLGGGYALTDEILLYGILNYISMDGKVESTFYDDSISIESDFEYNSLHLNLGMGYDFIPWSRFISVPVYAGVFAQRYSTELNMPDYTVSTFPTLVTASGSVSGDGILYGFCGGIAISFRIAEMVKVTPYYIFAMTMNEADVDASASVSGTIPYSESENITYGKIKSSMFGLNLEIYSERNISFGVSLGGYLSSKIPFIRDGLHEGLEVNSIVFIVSYNGGGY